MTVNKAIEMIDEYLLEPNCIHKDWVECLRLCRKVLEKQIPKKPDTKITNRGIDVSGEYNIDSDYICPICKCVVGECEIEEHWFEYCPNKVEQQKAEIERLRKVLENRGEICKSCDEKYTEKIKRAKAEAIKEFAERVKQEINFPLAVWKVFDNLVKEMVGDYPPLSLFLRCFVILGKSREHFLNKR